MHRENQSPGSSHVQSNPQAALDFEPTPEPSVAQDALEQLSELCADDESKAGAEGDTAHISELRQRSSLVTYVPHPPPTNN